MQCGWLTLESAYYSIVREVCVAPLLHKLCLGKYGGRATQSCCNYVYLISGACFQDGYTIFQWARRLLARYNQHAHMSVGIFWNAGIRQCPPPRSCCTVLPSRSASPSRGVGRAPTCQGRGQEKETERRKVAGGKTGREALRVGLDVVGRRSRRQRHWDAESGGWKAGGGRHSE